MSYKTLIFAVTFIVSLAAITTFIGVPVANAGEGRAQAQSKQQTTTFSIEKMSCAACPITVKKAMQQVDGVLSVKVDFDSKTATVVFDPAVATEDQIGSASTNAGYPATPAS